MEGLRDSKLEEDQQWGKNTSSKDKVHWGRRPPFIGGEKSNRYAHSPHRAVLLLVLMVLPLGVAILLLASGTKKIHQCLPPLDLRRVFGTGKISCGSKNLHPLQFGVVPLQPFQNTKAATTFANGYRIR